MDATPQNPKKPRLSRRLLSHFTLTLSVLLALSFVTLAVVGPSTQKVEAGATNWRDQVNWMDPWTYSFADEIYDYLISSKNNGLTTGDPEQYAQTLDTALRNSFTMVENQIKDFENHQNLLTYYYIRKAEWAARQLWLEQNSTGASKVFDPLYVLDESGICEDFEQYMHFCTQQFNEITSSLIGVGTNLTGFYSGVNVGIHAVMPSTSPYYNSELATPSTDLTLNLMFRTPNGNAELYYYDGESDLFVVADVARTYTIKDMYGSQTLFSKSISTGSIAIPTRIPKEELNLTAGLYTLEWGTIGNIWPVSTTKIIELISVNGQSSVSGSDPTHPLKGWYYSGSSKTITPDSVFIGAWVTVGQMANCYRIMPYIDAVKSLISAISSAKTNAINFAQSYYNAIVISGDPGGAWDLPLMLMPDPSQMEGMNWQQIYALYIAYLQQAHEWYQEHSGALDASRVNISAESLNLKVRGSIVNETGVTLYDNTTVWTPFITNEEMVLELGPNVVGFAMYGIKWGNSDSLQNFTISDSSTLIGIDPGYTLYIQEMIYQNETVET